MRAWTAFQTTPPSAASYTTTQSASAGVTHDGHEMTYCVGLLLKEGMVMVADTRTNAGVDNIATFRKLHVFEAPGDRVIALATAGNLAVTQAVVSHMLEGLPDVTGTMQTIYTVPSMFELAQFAGRAVRHVHDRDANALIADGGGFDCSLLVGGQIAGGPMRLFMIYRAGNFLEPSDDTPYVQVGEHKYGKPIIDRSITVATPLDEALKISLISMDSTLRSNLAVGLPVDACVIPRDTLTPSVNVRINEGDAYFETLRTSWSEAIRQAHQAIPNPPYGADGVLYGTGTAASAAA